MRYRPLGRTGIKVTPYALGAMMFGPIGNPDHDDCIRIINRALDAVVYGDRQLGEDVVASTQERTWQCQRVQEGVMSALGRHPAPDELQALAALLHIARSAGRLSEQCKKIAMIVPQVPDGQRGPIFGDLVDPAARVSVSAVWLAKQSFATRDLELAHDGLQLNL